MNVHPRSLLVSSSLMGWVLAAGAVLGAAEGNPTPTPTAAPKTHSLFMGTDVMVQRRDQLYHVQDVSGDALVVVIKGERMLVPLSRGMVAMKIEDGLKLARGEVTVNALKTERAYTPGNDPAREFLRNASAAGAAEDETNAAVRSMVAAEVAMNAASALPASNGARAVGMADAERRQGEAQRAFQAAGAAAGSDMSNAGVHAHRMGLKMDEQMFDAMEITFEVASERRLNHPYLIFIARLKEKGAKPGEFRNWIVAKSLDSLGPETRKVRIFQGGLPPGYEIDKCNLHFYDGTNELPSNLSPKRVLLSRDDAFQYMLLDHLSTHKNDTVPASVAMAQVPAELRTRAERGELGGAYYVKVTKEGLPNGVFLDPLCTQRSTTEDVTTVVNTVRFRPALEKGKPVEGVVTVKVSDLPL